MTLWAESHATVLLADHIAIDTVGKINALGLGFAISGIVGTGMTGPMHVAVMIDVPGKYAGEQCALSLELRNDLNQVVQLTGPSGQPEALRIQQLTRIERPSVPSHYLPPDMFCRVQMAVAFANGLPLEPGHTYTWKVQIDGNHRKDWVANFHVPGPPPPPVFGGPARNDQDSPLSGDAT